MNGPGMNGLGVTGKALAGLAILLVEDEFLVSAMLADALEEEGAVVVGPAATLAEGLRLAGGGGFDMAVLDWNLDGACSAPIARALMAAAVPVVIATGYGEVEAEFSGHRVLSKPFDIAQLVTHLRGLGPLASA